MTQSFGMFVVICALLTLTPGADTALILNSALKSGPRGVFFTNLGIGVGLFFHATMSSLGLSAILAESAQLYSFIKMLGAGYLMYLGLKALYDAFLNKTVSTAAPDAPATTSRVVAFRTGLLTNVLNPKVAVFYLTFLPQFIDRSHNVLLQAEALAAVHVLLSFGWLMIVGHFVSYFRAHLQKPHIKKRLEAITGLALLGFGLKLAVSKNR